MEPAKTVLITGAAQGVGLAAAQLLAQRSYRVILVDVQSVDSHVIKLCEAGLQAEGLLGDVSSEEFVRRLSERIAAQYGALDALVNNAGISLIVRGRARPAPSNGRGHGSEFIRAVPAVPISGRANARAPEGQHRQCGVHCRTRGYQPSQRLQRIEAWTHRTDQNAGGRMGRPRCKGQCSVPGVDQNRHGLGRSRRGPYGDSDIVDRVPLARFASTQDVAEAIAFLIDSDRSGFINGVSLPVDGGWTADASWNSLRLGTRA